MGTLWGREPVAIIAFIKAVLYLSVLFGFSLSPEQMAGIIVAVESALALLTRSQVSPVNREG